MYKDNKVKLLQKICNSAVLRQERRVYFIILLSLVLTNIYSHPHLFIKPELKPRISGNTLSGIEITWEWDKWWSNDVITYCDTNRDGKFDARETKMIYDDFFIGIKEFDFFTEIFLNNRKYNIRTVTDFSASIGAGNIVTYKFVVPLNIELTQTTAVRVSFNDETIYAAFDKISISSGDNFSITGIKTETKGFYGVQISAELKLN